MQFKKCLSFLSFSMLILTSWTTGQSENEYEGCGTTKGCFGQPENCLATEDCKVLVSYIINEEEKIQFTLSGDLAMGEYAALGLSYDQIMEDDSVVACWSDSSGIPQDAFESWNFEHSNYNVGIEDSTSTTGLVTLSKEYSDGRLRCTFTRETESVITPPYLDGANFTFNLTRW